MTRSPIVNAKVRKGLKAALEAIDAMPAESARAALKALARAIVERAPRTREGVMLGEVELAIKHGEAPY